MHIGLEEPPKFRGKICHGDRRNGFGFISCMSIHQIGGPPLVLPRQDLMIHVRENTALGDPLHVGGWITFFVRNDLRRKSGLLVFDAQLEQLKTPA